MGGIGIIGGSPPGGGGGGKKKAAPKIPTPVYPKKPGGGSHPTTPKNPARPGTPVKEKKSPYKCPPYGLESLIWIENEWTTVERVRPDPKGDVLAKLGLKRTPHAHAVLATIIDCDAKGMTVRTVESRYQTVGQRGASQIITFDADGKWIKWICPPLVQPIWGSKLSNKIGWGWKDGQVRGISKYP